MEKHIPSKIGRQTSASSGLGSPQSTNYRPSHAFQHPRGSQMVKKPINKQQTPALCSSKVNYAEFGYGSYHGGLLGGSRHGFGAFWFDSGEFYFGNWEKNSINGYGTMFFPNGSYARGVFANGVLNGPGIVNMANGDLFEGHWASGLMNGKCLKFSKESSCWKICVFSGGKCTRSISQGIGNPPVILPEDQMEHQLFSEADAKKTQNHLRALQGLSQNENGFGERKLEVLDMRERGKYIGASLNGKPDGLGAFLYANGSFDAGIFSNGQINGFGYVAKHGGSFIFGEMTKGKLCGHGLMYSADKNYFILGRFSAAGLEDHLIEQEGSGFPDGMVEQMRKEFRRNTFLNEAEEIFPRNAFYISSEELKTQEQLPVTDSMFIDEFFQTGSNFSPISGSTSHQGIFHQMGFLSQKTVSEKTQASIQSEMRLIPGFQEEKTKKKENGSPIQKLLFVNQLKSQHLPKEKKKEKVEKCFEFPKGKRSNSISKEKEIQRMKTPFESSKTRSTSSDHEKPSILPLKFSRASHISTSYKRPFSETTKPNETCTSVYTSEQFGATFTNFSPKNLVFAQLMGDPSINATKPNRTEGSSSSKGSIYSGSKNSRTSQWKNESKKPWKFSRYQSKHIPTECPTRKKKQRAEEPFRKKKAKGNSQQERKEYSRSKDDKKNSKMNQGSLGSSLKPSTLWNREKSHSKDVFMETQKIQNSSQLFSKKERSLERTAAKTPNLGAKVIYRGNGIQKVLRTDTGSGESIETPIQSKKPLFSSKADKKTEDFRKRANLTVEMVIRMEENFKKEKINSLSCSNLQKRKGIKCHGDLGKKETSKGKKMGEKGKGIMENSQTNQETMASPFKPLPTVDAMEMIEEDKCTIYKELAQSWSKSIVQTQKTPIRKEKTSEPGNPDSKSSGKCLDEESPSIRDSHSMKSVTFELSPEAGETKSTRKRTQQDSTFIGNGWDDFVSPRETQLIPEPIDQFVKKEKVEMCLPIELESKRSGDLPFEFGIRETDMRQRDSPLHYMSGLAPNNNSAFLQGDPTLQEEPALNEPAHFEQSLPPKYPTKRTGNQIQVQIKNKKFCISVSEWPLMDSEQENTPLAKESLNKSTRPLNIRRSCSIEEVVLPLQSICPNISPKETKKNHPPLVYQEVENDLLIHCQHNFEPLFN